MHGYDYYFDHELEDKHNNGQVCHYVQALDHFHDHQTRNHILYYHLEAFHNILVYYNNEVYDDKCFVHDDHCF